MLNSIHIVLVGTTHPGNIGAAARAMKTMGLNKLWLVQPKFFPDDRATVRAAGADDILASATVVDSLPEALAGVHRVYACTARTRRLAATPLAPRECAEQIAKSTALETALVFGREHAGLTNEELAACHALVHIPTNPDFASLNLASAVQVLAYELRTAAMSLVATDKSDVNRAPQVELRGLLSQLQDVMTEADFYDPTNPRKLMFRLERFFNRAEPDQTEVNIFRGILKAVQQKMNR